MAHTVDVNSGLQRKQFLHNLTAGSAGMREVGEVSL